MGDRRSKYRLKSATMARQRNDIEMVFRWRADAGPRLNASFVIFQGIRSSIAKKPYIFVIFQGGGGGGSGSPVSTLDPPMATT